MSAATTEAQTHAEPDADADRLVRNPRRVLAVSVAVCAVPAAVLAVVLWHNHGFGGAPGSGAKGGGHLELPVYLRLFFAVLAIGVLAHAGGWAARRLGQPGVVGEIVAGLLIGPSLLGRFLPGVTEALLPADVRGHLGVLAQVGLVLFMFSVGAEFDTAGLRRQGTAIGMLSQATMTVPFVLGLLLVPMVFPHFAGAGVGQAPFAIFLGTAISITAFPVLARIVEDAGLARTPLGSLAMVCAGIDDVLAWSALAVVLAVIQAGSPVGALVALPLAAGFAVFALLVLRPLLARAAGRLRHVRAPVAVRLVAVLCLVFTLAGITDRIGVHAIFGAFLAGIVLPRGSRFLADVPERLGSLNRALLLPIFFASIGLQVDVISAVTDPGLLLAGVVTLLVAIAGKLGSAALCARAGGLSWRASAGLGVLLNARGITEIVVLQTGLAIGVINEQAFTVLVFMALVTTVMTMPLLRLLGLAHPPPGPVPGNPATPDARIADRATADARMPDRPVVDERVVDRATTDARFVDRAAADARLADHATTDERLADHASADMRMPDRPVVDERVVDRATTDARIADRAAVDARLADRATTDAHFADRAMTDERLADHASADVRMANHAAVDAPIADDAEADAQTADRATTNPRTSNPATADNQAGDPGDPGDRAPVQERTAR